MKFNTIGIGCLYLTSLFFGSTNLMVAAQTPPTTQKPATATPEATVRSFYKWYLHELNQNHNPVEKPGPTMKKYVTARLLKEIDRMVKGPDGLDGDYFIDAQDWDKEWEDNIVVSALAEQGTKASMNVQFKGPNMSRNVRVNLLQQQGTWKVDKVEELDR
ncbi:MAG: YbjP/YqhG family protein [Blastocatellia bacterium]|nr:YbjP/YqhG family protein [Blastocatellia bacterium]